MSIGRRLDDRPSDNRPQDNPSRENRPGRHFQRGAATVEFYVVGFFVMIPLIMAVMQMGMYMVAKDTVNLGVFAAARVGAAGGSKSDMRNQFAKSIAPLYPSGATPVTAGNYAVAMGSAYARASVDAVNPVFTSITVLNPTTQSFNDFGIAGPNGTRVIPTTNLLTDTRVGAQSHQSRADALLLKVEARYCYTMVFPVIGKLVTSVLESLSTSPSDLACYVANRVPIVSHAIVRITEPPLAGNLL
jgi:Flp pilus assembly protein TadG